MDRKMEFGDARGSGTGARLGRKGSTGAKKRGLSRAAFATRHSSYIRCCELRREGRTVGKRLGMCPPNMRDDGFGVALEEGARGGSGVKPGGSSNNCERGTTAACLEASEAGRRSIRITR
jgi:hypothetical protein